MSTKPSGNSGWRARRKRYSPRTARRAAGLCPAESLADQGAAHTRHGRAGDPARYSGRAGSGPHPRAHGGAISSSREQLLCISDLALHPLHLEEPGWVAAVDMLPDQLVGTRRALFARAAADKCRVMAFHFPFPGLGRVCEGRSLAMGAARIAPVMAIASTRAR